MSTIYRQPIQEESAFQDASLDAFSRLRVSDKTCLFDAQHHYGQQTFNFRGVATTGGTLTDAPNTSSLTLAVTGTVGSKYVNRSKRHYYIAGQSHMIMLTGAFGTTLAGIRKSIGYNDNDDGIRFENIGGVVSIVMRTSTSGTHVDTPIAQSTWNVDKLDGSGPSGITIDWTKAQIFAFDLQYLGVGRVRCYVDIDGLLVKVHEIKNANNISTVYWQTPHLPCSYEIENLASATGDSFSQICSSVYTEGSLPSPSVKKSISNEVTGIVAANGVHTHVLSIRPAALFKTRANKGMIVPLYITIYNAGTSAAIYHLLENATLTTPTWIAQGDVDSIAEVCRAAGGFTGGKLRVSGVGSNATGSSQRLTEFTYQLQIDPSNVPDVLTIVAAGIGGTATVYAAITWNEFY